MESVLLVQEKLIMMKAVEFVFNVLKVVNMIIISKSVF